MTTLGRREISKEMVDIAGLDEPYCRLAMDALFKVISDHLLKGDTICFRDFATFSIKQRAGRRSMLKDGKGAVREVYMPAHYRAMVKLSPKLQRQIDEALSK